LRRLVEEYAARPDSADPRRQEHDRRVRAAHMRRELLDAVPAARRPAARLLLGLSAERIPLRGVAKRSFLQALDVARAAARRCGECLAVEGRLDDPDDVFYLTYEELTRGLPRDAAQLVARRRQRRAEYQRLSIPGNWTGMPSAARPDESERGAATADVVTGIGVSTGVVEGRARVVTSPDFAEVERDEVLVAPTTDPSWSSIMFVSSALVVDIGGALSHAAVVARELGIPCVVNTRSGTRELRTGDLVRVDGSKGTVEILQRASKEATS
jgi:pyruvate,water dikinase